MHDRQPWLGSKAADGVFQAIIAAMPPHDTYIETHLGSGAVMKAKPPALRSIGIDRDPRALSQCQVSLDRGIELVNADCVHWLSEFDFATAGRVLIYADPPYPLSTRTSTKRYRFDYTDADHKALFYNLRLMPAAVMISTYPNALYADMLSDWRKIEFQAMTRGGVRTEQLYMNFPAGPVHWASFAGANHTARQQVKRKAARWAAKYQKLPQAERLAVLSAILEHS